MRARLSAKSTIDGVEIPKVLETQVKAFEAAYQAAYQADLTVDKARNTIDRTITQANAMGDMVTLFGEIEELKQKIGDDTKGLTKKINDLDTKIASNSNAAHSENPSEQRQREAEGKQGEITAANEVKQQAIREGDSHDTAKKEALRDKRSAEEAVLDEEARIRKEISDRKTSLQDQITKNS